ncbi:MAG TPA: ABC transporter permease [Solirubrobacteraceae bacterium]|nr:ABC transporter permease [Solirubrobacteraceae bacterium]
MPAIILTNLRRRPTRTLLTAAGIAVGIATIVALLSFTQGLRESAASFVHLGGSELGVFQANVSEPTTSLLPESTVAKLQRLPQVAEATPLLLIVEGVKQDPAAVVFGAQPDGFFSRQLVILSGRRPSAGGKILVGDRLAAQAKLAPGATLAVEGHSYTVAGIYHSGILFEDSGAILDLADAQALAQRPGEATNVIVSLSPGTPAEPAARAIERALPGTQAITTAQQALRAGANGTLISKAILVIVAIALVVGIIGVANTMAMAIAERRSELGLLSTIGWSPARVAALILGEGVAVSVLGAAGGLLLGVIGGEELVRALGVSAYVSPSVTAWGLGRGLLVGIAIGVLGGIYPAWRVTRMTPLKALSGT